MSNGAKKKRVLIIGAGLGGLSAAWHLTKTRKDVTVEVYEASWVPGGKAASGRSEPPPPAGKPHLVEEHGLHMLFGTYRETWRLLSDCYEEVSDRPPNHAFRRIEQAFTPHSRIVFDEQDEKRRSHRHWVFCPAPATGRAWDADRRDDGSGDRGLLLKIPERLDRESTALFTTAIEMFGSAVRPLETLRRAAVKAVQVLDPGLMRDWLGRIGGLCMTPRPSSLVMSRPRLALAQVLRLATSARRIAELLDLGFAVLDGTRQLAEQCTCQSDGRRCDCLDKLNELDLRQWLEDHGWDDRNDAIVRGFYAGLFARKGELAAGVGLRAILRVFFDYEGALVYRMQSGMGEVVVAPIYQALKKHNVEFRFLKRLADLEVAGGRVTKLHFETRGVLGPGYEPFKTTHTLHGEVDYLPSSPPADVTLPAPPRGESHRMHRRWPTGGPRETVVLDPDDCVILAIPPKVLNSVAPALKQNVGWKSFLEGQTATASRHIASAQIWQTVLPACPENRVSGAVAAGHQPTFDVWADMSHLLSYEGFPHEAVELDYLCGPRKSTVPASTTTQEAEIRNVAADLNDWLEREGPYMLGRRFDPADRAVRYIAASLEPSDEYVLSLPKTIVHRIAPGVTGFANLRVAGDWVKNGLDCGCVESAVTGGLMAAQSIP